MATSTINAVFGKATEIYSLVDKWVAESASYLSPGVDPTTGEVRKPVELEPLHVPLSLSFGNLKTGDTLEKLDDNSKMLIAVVCMVVEKIPKGEQTYDTTTQKKIFNFKGSVDPGLVTQAHEWIQKFVGADVLTATHLDSNALGAVVAQTGAVITGFKDIITQTTEYTRPALNIGVIQFPDSTQPDFKLYHIDLTAWSHCETLAVIETNENGIRGSFKSRSITLRKSVIGHLAEDKKQKLIAKGSEIFK